MKNADFRRKDFSLPSASKGKIKALIDKFTLISDSCEDCVTKKDLLNVTSRIEKLIRVFYKRQSVRFN